MPVKTTAYEVEDVLGSKNIKGILHYSIKFYNYKKIYSIPFWDVNYATREWYNEKRRKQQADERNVRYQRYTMRKEWEAVPVERYSGSDDENVIYYPQRQRRRFLVARRATRDSDNSSSSEVFNGIGETKSIRKRSKSKPKR